MLCKCGNVARYINEKGELCCAICPFVDHVDSIRLADVPALLKWCRAHLDTPMDRTVLRAIIGKGTNR